MKQLLLLRHGKSDWGTELASDHERPLNPRGERAARRVGQFLRRVELVPDRVVSSS
ncbi:MAG: histidine phosphatase family protein, partial [Thermoanaerobaculia bacterium]|nr:histidine phosphatase family protein [Thermoanaerobaculia bacterium]